MKFKTINLLDGVVPKINDTDFLLVLESCSSDDGCSNQVWGHYKTNSFDFSDNIIIVSAVYTTNACAVVVRKKDVSIKETIEFNPPDFEYDDSSEGLKITF